MLLDNCIHREQLHSFMFSHQIIGVQLCFATLRNVELDSANGIIY
jgi:hypothetical protein